MNVAAEPVSPVRHARAGSRPLGGGLAGFRVALAAFLLVPAVIVGLVLQPSRAEAFVSPPAPVTIGTAVKTIAPRALMLTNPWGLALNAAALGFVAYQERDSWLPIVQGIFGGDSKQSKAGAGTALCYSFDIEWLDGARPHGAAIRSFNGTGCGAVNAPAVHECSCKDNNGFYTKNTVTSIIRFDTPPPSGPGTAYREYLYCPVGSTMTQFKVVSTGPQALGEKYLQRGVLPGQVRQTVDVTCRQPDGSMVAISDTLVGEPEKIAVPSCADRVPGSIPWTVVVKGGPIGGLEREIVRLDTKQDVFDEYADCFGPTGLQCVIRVWVLGESCTVGAVGCTNWQQYAIDYPNRVECKFGSHVVPLAQCEMLKRSYKTSTTSTPVKVNPDGSVEPDTGTDPGTDPGTGTGGSSFPQSGTNPAAPSVKPDGSTDSDTRSCFGEAWGWNPVDWVFVPVKCTFIWAFVPKTSLETRVQAVKDAAAGKAPFSWVAEIGSIPSGLGIVGGACPDWRIKVGPLDQNVVCDSSYTQAIRAGRPIFAGSMILLATWPLIRSIAYASFPVIKPTPSR